MLIKVYKSMIPGLSDLDGFYINTDYIVSMEKNDNAMSISMVNGYTYNIDEESYNRIIKLKSISKDDIQQMLLEDCKTMMKEKQNEEKVIYKIPVGDIPEDVKRDKLEKLKKEMKEIRNNSDWEIIDE